MHRVAEKRQWGFTILELIFASAILLFGIVAVAQLVPAGLRSSLANRLDTMATVIAQRELDQMISQPLSVITFVDKDGHLISMGGAGSPGAALLSGVASAEIDFAAPPVDGFNIPSYVDINDPSRAEFELRWAVIPEVVAGTVVSKRIILGCRQKNPNQPILPVNLDTWVQKF